MFKEDIVRIAFNVSVANPPADEYWANAFTVASVTAVIINEPAKPIIGRDTSNTSCINKECYYTRYNTIMK
jgi:uncharacterized protein (DUF362 family)